MRPLLIAQAPSREPCRPLGGDSGRRLARAAGVTLDELLAAARVVNLMPAFAGRNLGKGDRLDAAEARRRASAMRIRGRVVVLVGMAVARAFGFADATPLGSAERGGWTWHFLPHPSGVNLWWNDRGNAERAGRMMRRVLGLDKARRRGEGRSTLPRVGVTCRSCSPTPGPCGRRR